MTSQHLCIENHAVDFTYVRYFHPQNIHKEMIIPASEMNLRFREVRSLAQHYKIISQYKFGSDFKVHIHITESPESFQKAK